MNIKEVLSLDRHLLIALEETEAVYWSKYYYTDERLPCFANVIGGAFAGSVPDVNILALNRVIGLGIHHVVNPGDIEAIINFYKKAGAKQFIIQLAGHAIQDDLPEMLSNAGFILHNHWAKLMKRLDEPTSVSSSDLRIEKIMDNHLYKEDYGKILFESFRWEDPRLKDWLCKTIGQMGYRHFLAYQGDKPIAAAALHLMGKYASLAFAGTLPSYRGLGAQQALIQHRLKEASQAGCEYIFTETAAPNPENPAQSYKNMIRLGFEEVYLRENWIYKMAGTQ